MKKDLCLKIILAIIALCLIILLFKPVRINHEGYIDIRVKKHTLEF